LQAKYETVERLNEFMGTRFWTQIVTRFEDVPMPMKAPTVYNPALLLDWMRFSSDTIVAFVKMQVDLLHGLTPGIPVTNNLRALTRSFDHFDVADVLDFVGVDSNATIKTKSAENACRHGYAAFVEEDEHQNAGEDGASGRRTKGQTTSTGRRSIH